MGFYNFSYLLKNILYHFSKIFKYLSICLLACCFIAICLLLMSNNSKAETLDQIPTDVINSANNWCKGNLLIFKDDATGLFYVPEIRYPSNVTSHQNGNWTLRVYTANNTAYEVFISPLWEAINDFWVYDNGWFTATRNSFNANSMIQKDMGNRHLRVAYASKNVLYRSFPGHENGSIYYDISQQTFVAPEVSFPNNDGTTDYISGEFRHFMILGNSAESLYFNFNDGSVVGTDTYLKSVHLLLDSNSPYLLNNYENNNVYLIPKNILGDYLDGHIYNLQLEWSNNGVTSFSPMYSWTTDFSEQAILNDDIERQSKIESGIDDINNFLNNDSYNSQDIISNMPSTDIQDPTESSVNNIFNMFRNAFNTTNSPNIVFEIPNTGQSIVIPSNLVISKIPQPILVLIQSFYWFIICRFIVKDICKIIENAKSGEILDAKDGNIKTELL